MTLEGQTWSHATISQSLHNSVDNPMPPALSLLGHGAPITTLAGHRGWCQGSKSWRTSTSFQQTPCPVPPPQVLKITWGLNSETFSPGGKEHLTIPTTGKKSGFLPTLLGLSAHHSAGLRMPAWGKKIIMTHTFFPKPEGRQNLGRREGGKAKSAVSRQH